MHDRRRSSGYSSGGGPSRFKHRGGDPKVTKRGKARIAEILNEIEARGGESSAPEQSTSDDAEHAALVELVERGYLRA